MADFYWRILVASNAAGTPQANEDECHGRDNGE